MSSTATTPAIDPAEKSMDELVALCKRRGFVYPASEIYGGINGFWDYGPLGTQLKNNIRDWWWKNLVECPPIGPDGEPISIVGLDSAIIQNPKTWEASGHVGGFSDPMVDDREEKKRFRADHFFAFFLAPASGQELERMIAEERLGLATYHAYQLATVVASTPGEAIREFEANQKKLLGDWRFEDGDVIGPPVNDSYLGSCENKKTGESRRFRVQPITFDDLVAHADKAVSPYSGKRGTLTEPREFNLMFETYVGAIRDEDAKAYLRPETAQGIFLNYKNVLDTMRVKMPFGIAQIGKSFRNEVTPRNFIFRSREFEQMEMEWFCAPDEAPKWYEFWKEQRMNWWRTLGIDPGNLRFRDHDEDELAHYSKMCVDVEYKYPFTAPGFGELEGIAHRGCFDLTQHQEHSKTKMEYFDQERQLAAKAQGKSKDEINAASKYIPNVIEPASGLTRAVLVLLCEAFTPTPDRQGSKYILSFKPRFAPVKAGIFPLVNKDGMPEVAQKLYQSLRGRYMLEYDAKQSIGKRYARMDEIGTPMCFTVDGQTLEDQTVTVRDRDTLAQQRIHLDKVGAFIDAKLAE